MSSAHCYTLEQEDRRRTNTANVLSVARQGTPKLPFLEDTCNATVIASLCTTIAALHRSMRQLVADSETTPQLAILCWRAAG
ncbi:hypothetical protein PILCRDRAFT_601327 [Piloderma croceum F 1598]|uniref:Uncharacterized protein n=1 Tax=Piloderma croceum (strain F 1598) TaxID=765440 RepID=A0A0C3FDV0_PILCF|nr:hypothetical protein PILCRDRAFT_601327 [Piloderma croceum F 1598]